MPGWVRRIGWVGVFSHGSISVGLMLASRGYRVLSTGSGGGDRRAAIAQVTVSAGGAPSCRVALREALQISFTIHDPRSGATWQIQTNSRHSVSPSSGSADSAGPFQAIVQFNSFGGDNRIDDTFRITTSDQLGCSVAIHGHN